MTQLSGMSRILIANGASGSVEVITALAKESGIPVQHVDSVVLDRISGGAVHQGTAAYVMAFQYSDVDDMLKLAGERGEDPFLILLDGIEDPHNLGAIMRTAECCGAHGIIIPKRRAVGLTPTVARTSAGAINYTPVAKLQILHRLSKI